MKKYSKQALFRMLSICIGFAFAILLLIGVEWMSSFLLGIRGYKTYPFLMNTSYQNQWQAPSSAMFQGDMYTFFDPHLGYAHNPNASLVNYKDLPGFTIYQNGKSTSPLITIVTLGGSTTDGNTAHIWPQAMQEILDSKGYAVRIINGGVAGFSSSQELIKLIRDVIPLKPDLIISLNGVNEYQPKGHVRWHPMVSTYQKVLMDYLVKEDEPFFIPNTINLFKIGLKGLNPTEPSKRGINYGPKVDINSSLQWLRNVRMMSAICKEFDIPYLVFLQPALGIGEYQLSVSEKKMLENEQGDQIYGYLTEASSFYKEARIECHDFPQCIDLVDIYYGKQNMYADKLHPNVEGYHLIAEIIASEIETRKILSEVHP